MLSQNSSLQPCQSIIKLMKANQFEAAYWQATQRLSEVRSKPLANWLKVKCRFLEKQLHIVKRREYVDPRLVYGFEHPKSLEIVTSLVKALESGDRLPPVYLHKVSDVEYHIPFLLKYEYSEGGHHRMIAHHLLNKKVECVLVNRRVIPKNLKTLISKIPLEQNTKAWKAHAEGKDYLDFSFGDMSKVITLLNQKNGFNTGVNI